MVIWQQQLESSAVTAQPPNLPPGKEGKNGRREEERRQKRIDLKKENQNRFGQKWSKINCCVCSLFLFCRSPPTQEWRRDRAASDPTDRAPTVAAARGFTRLQWQWRVDKRATTIPVPRNLPAVFSSLFCILFFRCWNVYLNYWQHFIFLLHCELVIMGVIKYSKKVMCVFVSFFFMYILF
jgi:hypothetical protein